MATIHIATEDLLSQAVAECLVRDLTNFEVDLRLGLRGNGHLKANLGSYCEIARQNPVLLIADLDLKECAVVLRNQWSARVAGAIPANFLFRVAKREIESWVLADTQAMEKFLGITLRDEGFDEVEDPKRLLLNLAKKAPKDIRQELVVVRDGALSQGYGYNGVLAHFVKSRWSALRAERNSDSLLRTCRALRQLNARYF